MAGTALRNSVHRVVRGKGLGFFRHASASSGTNIIKSPFDDVEIPNCSLPEFLFDKTKNYTNKIAFECSITGRKYTYEQIRTKSRNLNRALRKKLKLQKDDVVAVLLPNVPEFPIAVLGILLAGLRVTTLNPIYTPDEIKRQLNDSGTKALITLTELYTQAKAALGSSQMPIITINDQPNTSTIPGAINFNEFVDNVIDYDDVYIDDQNQVAAMPYSSGTTGLPKGVLLSHRNIVANLQQYECPEVNLLQKATDTHQDVIPAILPMFHIYGFTVITFASMIAGAKIVTMPKFTPDLYIDVLRDHKPNALFVVPPIVIFLYAHPGVTKELLGNVRVLMSGAAPLGALDEQKFKDKVGRPVQVTQGYGLTEASPIISLGSRELSSKPGSIGHLIPNTEIKIMPVDNANGEVFGLNQTGELFVRGPQIMLGYHNRPEETENTLLDGWLRTGDMAYYDEDQFLFITDRIKELIKVKGFQVPPAELEEILRDYPGVGDAAVIGIPHQFHGEVPRAYVVAKSGQKLDAEKINEFVTSKVAEYKKLRGGIQIINEIPKNASGKILRRQLKTQYLEEQQ